jgi:hypothetical protein
MRSTVLSELKHNPVPLSDRSPCLPPEQEQIATAIQDLAQDYQQDVQQLLSLLRTLEQLHQHIRDQYFQAALPTTRQALYSLLREIEAAGGWPYIPRMHIKSLVQNWLSHGEYPGESGEPDH